MNLSWIDWLIFIGLFVALNFSGWLCRKHTRGIADFLVAGRNVGRFLGVGADSMANLGAISIIAMWQMNYNAGFSGLWWFMLTPVLGILVALTGWGIYRFRQTRAMTLGQFMEMRYDKRTRILFSSLAYAAGVLNMGIFPAATASFFVYYCGFPAELNLWGLNVPTILPIMIIVEGSAVAICFWGGQITVVITSFIQSVFVDIILVGVAIVVFKTFDWHHFAEAFTSADNSQALLNPYHGEGASEFNKWFFLIFAFWTFYHVVSWAPNANIISSASAAHEGKMMRVMIYIKLLAAMGLGIFLLPLAVFIIMHHPDFADKAASIKDVLSTIGNSQIQSQMLTPTALHYILPVGLLGAFAGVVMFAALTTDDTYMLAWGSMLIQDIIIPLRGGKPLEPKRQMRWIRTSILGVAVFIVLFSLFFKQVDNIYMFFDISASLYMGAAGTVLLGGLYWSRATAKGAWITMLVGAVTSIAGFIYRLINPDFLDGRIMAFYIVVICFITYVIVSLLDKNPGVDLNKVFNRGTEEKKEKCKWYRFGPEVPGSDRCLIILLYIASFLFLAVFIGLWIYNTTRDVELSKWLSFWRFFLYGIFAAGSAFLVWIIIGGTRDLLRLFRSLKTEIQDVTDDGVVRKNYKKNDAE